MALVKRVYWRRISTEYCQDPEKVIGLLKEGYLFSNTDKFGYLLFKSEVWSDPEINEKIKAQRGYRDLLQKTGN